MLISCSHGRIAMIQMSSLPPQQAGHAPPALLAQRRQAMADARASGIWRTTPASQEVVIGGIRALRLVPDAPARGTVVHFHGGAFRNGCPEQVGAYALALMQRCDVEVICPAYRLAPECPFPAGLSDAVAIVQALSEETAGPLIIAGDSAGGGLAASLVALCVDSGVPLSGLILHSAWLDLTVTSQSYEKNAATDPLFSRDAAQDAAGLYLQGQSPRNPYASPLLNSVAGFPPTFISLGRGEVLADDSRKFERALHLAGVRSELLAVDGMEHVAVTRSLALAGAEKTLAATCEFIATLV
jgi:epsilon-lactone hydrolase